MNRSGRAKVNAAASGTQVKDARAARIVTALGNRSIVLVGIMGCGKSSVGRRLAQRLGLDFVDADTEIETAANMTISEIFALHGEPEFRRGEEKVIARLLQQGPQVLATGGGAFMSEATRNAIKANGVSVWLRADLATVMVRVRKRPTRPLLQNADPESTMRQLLEKREPVYALADTTVWSREVPHEVVMEDVISAVEGHLNLRTGRMNSEEGQNG
ncbi:shikimate kinase [Pannonibacter indicus]|uniref:Shikimate kinase n=1 Tax=Pannonibacter indicus TaxID=466044 RepID=A0A0K6I0I1_9HYPH|nr:shikimate kinase [Pannonibacter indicus]CUA96807.1 shikimate kinase [Pannonibacter indicus]